MTDPCGCGDPAAVRTPAVIENRPGLSAIGYRSGRHADFLAALRAGLSRADRPALARLRTRESDDPTIALLDAWAVTCDVLSFYTERLANESYLRTATERVSLQELGTLVSYRLNPGVAAETVLAFSLERPPAPPPLDPPDPGVVPPAVPSAVELPVGMRVQSVPAPGELPQTFETVEPVEARPEWNALPVARTAPHLPVMGRRTAYLAGAGLGLSPGDAILFASDDLVNDRWDVRLLTEVEVDPVADRTRVAWVPGLGSFHPVNRPADAPSTFALRKRLAVFGHNAPTWKAMHESFRLGYRQQFDPVPTDGAEWPFFTAVGTSGSHVVVDVDGAHPAIVTGSWVVLSQDGDGFYRELYEVVGRAELSRAAYGVSGKVTRLTLAGEAHAFGSPREVTVLAVSEPLQVVEAPDSSDVEGLTIVVDGDATAMAPGRAVVLTGTTTSGVPQAQALTLDAVAAVPAVAASSGARTALTFTTTPEPAFARAGAVVLGNVARATQGETVSQILGSGDARTPFQAFPLTQGPLTHVPADNPRGGESTLEVRVDDVLWSERATTFTAGPADRVYVTRDEPDGSRTVVLGDGVRGARASTGSNNVRAVHRKGLGAGGNVRADQLSQALDRPLGFKGVTNPLPATGGVDPEVEAHARVSIPLPVRTLGRAVSLLDHADFALAFTGIGKALAAVLPLPGGRAVVVTVADGEGRPPPDSTLRRLERTLREQGDPGVRVHVRPAGSATFRLALKIAVDPLRESEVVLAAVEAALRARYDAAARDLGAPVHRSEVVAVAASVVGVVGVDLDRLYRAGAGSLQERLVADPAHVAAGQPVGCELLALSPSAFDWLTEQP